MDRPDTSYAQLSSGQAGHRRRILLAARLNIVGRAAVVGSCLVAAGLGFAAGRLLGLPVAITAPAGGMLPLALLVAVDRRRWSVMLVRYGWGGTPDEVSAVTADLVRRGVDANVEMDHDRESASLLYRNADAEVVSTVLTEHGVPAFRHRF
jgi:hypothetical protein